MFLGTFVLRYILSGKGAIATSQGRETDSGNKGIIRADHGRPSSSALQNNTMDF